MGGIAKGEYGELFFVNNDIYRARMYMCGASLCCVGRSNNVYVTVYVGTSTSIHQFPYTEEKRGRSEMKILALILSVCDGIIQN